MIRSLFTSATGMVAQQMNIDTIANNLANVNTTGFKKSRVNFQDLMYETIKPAGSETESGTTIPEGIQVGHGVRPSAIAKVFTPGNAVQSGNALDIMIEGDGFFRVLMPDGRTTYTRDGAFKLSDNGDMITSDGYPLEDGITIPDTAETVVVDPHGRVSVLEAGQETPTQVGQIQLARFSNAAGLDAHKGHNLLLESQASGPPLEQLPGLEGNGTLAQGFLENSNVQVVEEIIQMIIAQRAYEANSKVIQTADDMLQTANNVRR